MGNRIVYQYEATYPYALIKEYPNTREAADAVSCSVKEIYESCLGRADLAGGYDWLLESCQHKKNPVEQYGACRST